MPTLFTEQPWFLGLLGAILTIASIFGWLQTGNRGVLISAISIAIVSILLVGINVWIVTDREFLQSWLSDAAGEVERNEYEKAIQRISLDATDRARGVATQLPHVKFSNARITKIHSIEVKANQFGTKAAVRMNVFVEGEINGIFGKTPRWVGLSLEKQNGRWLIVDFEDREPQHEFVGFGQ